MEELKVADFCELFGTEKIESETILNLISSYDFRYEYLTGKERDDVLLRVLKKINSKIHTVGDLKRWEEGWQENLTEFEKTNNPDSLIPKYVHNGEICRLRKNYIKTSSPTFEHDFRSVLQRWILETYMPEATDIFEFGCGSGYNIPIIAQMYPEKMIHGLDWARPAVEIVNKMKKNFNNVEGHLFDIFNPHQYELNIPEGSYAVTFNCLEQAGNNYWQFTNFLLESKVKRVLNIEPILHFYDENNLVDYLAIQYHWKRQYLFGYYTYLHWLESEHKIKIIKSKRVEVGNTYNDVWSLLFWEIL